MLSSTEAPKVMSINSDSSVAAESNLEDHFVGTSNSGNADGQANSTISDDHIKLHGSNKDGIAIAKGRLATAYAQGKDAKVVVDEVTETYINKGQLKGCACLQGSQLYY